MSLARECDRCGTLYRPQVFDPEEKYEKGRPLLNITIRTYGMEKDMDLCQGCADGLRNYLGYIETCMR